jgi:hypothetical protein
LPLAVKKKNQLLLPHQHQLLLPLLLTHLLQPHLLLTHLLQLLPSNQFLTETKKPPSGGFFVADFYQPPVCCLLQVVDQ